MAKKVLIVDDSALVRKQLREMLEPEGYEIDLAKNGQEAVDKATAKDYDVITMDINMPVLDGLSAVEKIMQINPTAILMVSSLTTADAQTTMDALDLGAIDYIAKPGTMNVGKVENTQEILNKVRSLSRIPKRRLKVRDRRPALRHSRVQEKRVEVEDTSVPLDKIILIGSSTGGPGLIEKICSSVPADFKHAIVVVQHMPAQFTEAFADRLDRVSKLRVQESKHGMEVLGGNIYVARGGTHLTFSKKVSGKITISENDRKGDTFFQPSVNEMFFSAVKVFDCKKVLAVLLTGIGDDGAEGMLALRNAGSYTIGESEDSAVVYGMPKVAYEIGAVVEQIPFASIVKSIVRYK